MTRRISCDLIGAAASRLRHGGAPLTALLLLLPAVWLVHYIYIYFDRSRLPDVEPFLHFELPTIGQVYDTRGKMLIELAREYRRVVSYDEVPPVLRHAILAAEDKNFFSHPGVEYGALPRIVYKTAVHSVAAWWKGPVDFRLHFPRGGSTLTQELVRGWCRPRSRRRATRRRFRFSTTARARPRPWRASRRAVQIPGWTQLPQAWMKVQ